MVLTAAYTCQAVVLKLRRLCPCQGLKSQQFTVGIELRLGCVLSTLLFKDCVNWVDSHS